MAKIALIFISLAAGIFLRRHVREPEKLAKLLNQYLIFVVLPAIALKYLPALPLSPELLLPIAAAWFSFLLAWGFFHLVGTWKNWGASTIGCLTLTGGLANTSFVGFPIIDALYGTEGLKIALLIDQAGSFILVSTLAVIVANTYSAEQSSKSSLLKKVITFPPFLFFIIGISMNLLELTVHPILGFGLETLAQSLTPVALGAVGLQLQIEKTAFKDRKLWTGLTFKLLLLPALIWLIFGSLSPLGGLPLKITLLEMAMAPMITGSILAISYNLNPRLASLMVGVGIPLSFLTIAFWYWVLESFVLA
ncbi:MAG: AEC family transporter [Nitritalea sp.]